MSYHPAMWLYVAIGDDGVLKVGSSDDPQHRMKLLRVERRQRFSICRTWHRPKADARLVEFIAHSLLRPHCCLGREFYQASVETLYDAVELAIRKAESGDISDLGKHSFVAKRLRAASKDEEHKRLWGEARRLFDEAMAAGWVEPFLTAMETKRGIEKAKRKAKR